MKSLDTLLAEAVSKMKPATRQRFSNKTTTGETIPQEALINIAESMLREDSEEIRESGFGGRQRITRNNGGSRQLTESEHRESAMQEADAILFEGMEKCRSTAKGISQLVESGGEYRRKAEGTDDLTESQRADLEFCRQLGMSESDAIKVAKSDAIRGN